ncbi:MAG: hypothetical protein MK237_09095 [Gemmatimonadetes bacterium]|nr:hypothetical protein [Gemmatimonadota bacterium]
MNKKNAIAVAVSTSGACVTVSTMVLDRSFYSRPVAQEEVTLLLASFGDSMPENCTRVGILHAKGRRFTDEGGIYEKLRSEAGTIGANTVFVQNMEDASGAQVIAETLGGRSADRASDALALFCDSTAQGH